MMACPQCGANCITRMTAQRNEGRERTYVCKCGWAFDTRETVFRTRSPEQRERYRAGDPTVRSLAQKAKSLQRITANGWERSQPQKGS